jgi:O-antigen ligase
MVTMVKNTKSMLNSKDKIARRLVIAGVAITLVITPWINKDSIVIPKQVLLVLIAASMLSVVIPELKKIAKSRIGKIILYLEFLTILQISLVMVISKAPIEQELFGRSGRALGSITYLSLIVVLIASIRLFNFNNLHLISNSIIITGFIVALYAILQSYGIDIFAWDSKTNGVISTLGNPNFTSAFIAAFAVPVISLNLYNKKKQIIVFPIVILIIFTISRTESIQGYLAFLISISIYILVLTWYRSKRYFIILFTFIFSSIILLLIGTLGHGTFARLLYKTSIQSRGDFWRGAFNTANSNPIFGVGIDSFGDNYLKYRDEVAANHPWAEFTDSAHNYILDFASQGGYPLAILQALIILLVIVSFVKVQSNLKSVNPTFLAIFSSWAAIQATFVISPLSIPLLFWNAIYSGALIGLAISQSNLTHQDWLSEPIKIDSSKSFVSIISTILAILLMFQVVNSDRLFAESLKNNDANLGLKVIEMFPRSTTRYTTVGRLLLESGENKYSLDVARETLRFNQKTITAWALILVNPLAGIEERSNAKDQILKLDPLNKEIPNYEIK